MLVWTRIIRVFARLGTFYSECKCVLGCCTAWCKMESNSSPSSSLSRTELRTGAKQVLLYSHWPQSFHFARRSDNQQLLGGSATRFSGRLFLVSGYPGRAASPWIVVSQQAIGLAEGLKMSLALERPWLSNVAGVQMFAGRAFPMDTGIP